eukprot:4982395-Amphidinium_carterae.1
MVEVGLSSATVAMGQHLDQRLEHTHITPEVVADVTKAMHEQLDNGEFKDEWQLRLQAKLREIAVGLGLVGCIRGESELCEAVALGKITEMTHPCVAEVSASRSFLARRSGISADMDGEKYQVEMKTYP